MKRIALKSFHLPLESSADQIYAVAAKARKAGIDLYGCGVVYMKNEEEVHGAFNYAKAAGMRVIIGVPEHNLLELVNKKVQEYNIKLAIHNHGSGDKRYPMRINYKGSVSFEFEKDSNDPLAGVAESVGYVRGVLDGI